MMTGCSYLGCTGTATASATERNRPDREHSERGKSSPVPKPLCHRIVPPAVLPPCNAVPQVQEDSPPRLPRHRSEMARIELQDDPRGNCRGGPWANPADRSPLGPRLVAATIFPPLGGPLGIEATSRSMGDWPARAWGLLPTQGHSGSYGHGDRWGSQPTITSASAM